MKNTVVTVLDNGKLLKPQALEDGNLVPFFEVNKTNEKGVNQLSEKAEDWTNFGFSTEEEYKEAIKRKPVNTKSV